MLHMGISAMWMIEQQGNVNNSTQTAQAFYHLLTRIKMTWTTSHHGVHSSGGQGKNSSYCVKTSKSSVPNKNFKLFGCNVHKCCQWLEQQSSLPPLHHTSFFVP